MSIKRKLSDRLKAGISALAVLVMSVALGEVGLLKGVFEFEHIRDGKVIYTEKFPNTVVTVGKNLALDTFLAGSSYTVTGPYLGMISSASYSAISAADTMASHAGWLEAGTTNAPQWTTPAAGARATCAWSAASAGSKALSAAAAFSISTSGTLKGAFIVFGSGAVATNLSTAGTLLSAGLFTGGDRAVLNGDTVNVSYSLSL